MKKLRGFALWPREKLQAISSRAGRRAHQLGLAHEFDSEEAIKAGRAGGVASARVRSQRVGAENLISDRR